MAGKVAGNSRVFCRTPLLLRCRKRTGDATRAPVPLPQRPACAAQGRLTAQQARAALERVLFETAQAASVRSPRPEAQALFIRAVKSRSGRSGCIENGCFQCENVLSSRLIAAFRCAAAHAFQSSCRSTGSQCHWLPAHGPCRCLSRTGAAPAGRQGRGRS